jgi:hypothetical protein
MKNKNMVILARKKSRKKFKNTIITVSSVADGDPASSQGDLLSLPGLGDFINYKYRYELGTTKIRN